MSTFETYLAGLGKDICSSSKMIILGGDFNSKSYLWREKQDARGDTLNYWMSQQNINVANLGTTPTFF